MMAEQIGPILNVDETESIGLVTEISKEKSIHQVEASKT